MLFLVSADLKQDNLTTNSLLIMKLPFLHFTFLHDIFQLRNFQVKKYSNFLLFRNMDDICHKKKSFTELNHKMTNEEDNILE